MFSYGHTAIFALGASDFYTNFMFIIDSAQGPEYNNAFHVLFSSAVLMAFSVENNSAAKLVNVTSLSQNQNQEEVGLTIATLSTN